MTLMRRTLVAALNAVPTLSLADPGVSGTRGALI